MKQLLFWSGYFIWPVLLVSIVLVLRHRGGKRLAAIVAVVLISVVAYARFVEPQRLTVDYSEIALAGAGSNDPAVRVALFSDTHFGVFRNAVSMQRIVEKLIQESPDAVMIAGDFLYHLESREVSRALEPLKQLNVPVFAVLGNHDVGFPGPDYTETLYQALREIGVVLVENQARSVVLGGQEVVVAGASDLWQREQDFSFSSGLPTVPTLLLTHNPDTAFHVSAEVHYDLMLAGHTHGGQIRIPWLFRKVIPTDYPFDKGLHKVQVDSKEQLVFVTPGTGMVGLPLRLGMPPRIDILTLRIPKA